jgi:AraC family transcriptional regulator
MPESTILMRRAGSGAPLRLAGALLASSPAAPHAPLWVERQQLPATETGEIVMDRHFLAVQLGPAHVLESLAPGRFARHRLAPGDTWFKAAGEPGSYAWRSPIDVLELALDPRFLRWVAARDLGMEAPELPPHGQSRGFAAVAQAIAYEVAAGNPGGMVTMDAYAMLAALYVLRSFGAAAPAVPASGLPTGSLARVREYVEENLAEDLRLAELADVAHLSPYHFARCFRAATGRSPHQYVLDRRVEAARRALATRSVPIGPLARAVGFAGAGHLSRHFRARLGVTPGEYARSTNRR